MRNLAKLSPKSGLGAAIRCGRVGGTAVRHDDSIERAKESIVEDEDGRLVNTRLGAREARRALSVYVVGIGLNKG